jgi:oligosaccharide repeat unit polymerase
MTFPAAVALLVIGAKPGAKRYAALGLGLLSALLVLLAGDRGIALHSLLVVVVVWVKLGRRLPTAVALLTLLGVLISIPLVGHLRMMGTYSEIDQEKIEAAARDMNVVTGLVGLGATLHGLGIVLEQFPQQQDYRYGSTYVGALRAGIPNLSFQKSAPQVDLSGSTMSREVVQNLSPSSWLAYHVLGRQKMLQGHGTGFTAVGEPYMNFGVPGVALFFMVLGYWLGRLEVIDLTSNRLVLVFVLACLPNLIATTRNDFIAFTKPTSFVVIILVASYGITWVWRRGVTRMA